MMRRRIVKYQVGNSTSENATLALGVQLELIN